MTILSKYAIVLVVIGSIFTSCDNEVKNTSPIPNIPIEIIKANPYKSDSTLQIACLLINVPDTMITYYHISQNLIAYCKENNIIASKVYINKSDWELDIAKSSVNYLDFESNYLALVDFRKIGLNWKYIASSDNIFYNIGTQLITFKTKSGGVGSKIFSKDDIAGFR